MKCIFPLSKKIFYHEVRFSDSLVFQTLALHFLLLPETALMDKNFFGLHFFFKIIIICDLWWRDYFIDFTPLYVFVALWQLHFIFLPRLIPLWETKISIKNWRRLFAYFLKVHISSEWCGTYPGGARQWEKALSRRDISSYSKKTLQRVGTCWRIIYKTCWYL